MAKKAAKKAAAGLPDLEDLEDLPDLPDLPDLEPLDPLDDLGMVATRSRAPSPARAVTAAARTERFVVNARDGLRLRSGPDLAFPAIRTVAFNTPLFVIGREQLWSQVDLEGDGAADGFMLSSLLRPAGAVAPTVLAAAAPAAAPGGDILDRVTPDLVASIFPSGTPKANIVKHLPFVIAGLRAQGLADRSMALMALGTIRAETEGFAPISEFKSKFNTAVTPFDKYDAGTKIGKNLGNTVKGDGPAFKGRGFIQLTGRHNYTRVGTQIGHPLVTNPELANDSAVAGLILATFLKNQESRIRTALAAGNLKVARRAVNGGLHGFDRFSDTFRRGEKLL